jgi:hypothetical protein
MVSKSLTQRFDEWRICQGGSAAEEPDPVYRPRRLRSRPERRGEKGKTGCTEERTPLDHPTPERHRPRHLMTSSARVITSGGMVNPSAFAVLELITSSNRVAC